MRINLILIPFVIILGLLLSNNDNEKKRKIYIVVCSIVLILVASLRSPEWMTLTYNIDTLVYQNGFENIHDMSWSNIWSAVYGRYWLHKGENDIGYIFLQKIIGLITYNYNFFSLLADLIFFIPFGMILYRYSTSIRQIMFAYVFYIALVQVFLLGGGRQIFAIGFDMMALLAMGNRKTWRAIIFLLLGVSIHFSSFLFLLPLLMIRFKASPRLLKFLHLACFLVFPIVLLFSSQLIVIFGESIGMEKYANYGDKDAYGGGRFFLFLIELLSLFCFIAIKRKDMGKHDNIHLLYVMFPLMTLLAPLIYTDGAMIRVSLYYHLFLTLLVPYALDCIFNKESRWIVYAVAILALSFLALRGGGMRYYFFWQA